jgi:hypothetical protein
VTVGDKDKMVYEIENQVKPGEIIISRGCPSASKVVGQLYNSVHPTVTDWSMSADWNTGAVLVTETLILYVLLEKPSSK